MLAAVKALLGARPPLRALRYGYEHHAAGCYSRRADGDKTGTSGDVITDDKHHNRHHPHMQWDDSVNGNGDHDHHRNLQATVPSPLEAYGTDKGGKKRICSLASALEALTTATDLKGTARTCCNTASCKLLLLAH